MNTDESALGRCPDCGESIPEAWLLVEYEKDDGTDGVWAECPVCEDVVAPE
ncbi:phage terminase large subunit family protein [Halorientalis marina]|uniref:phage terminase large subunit family protein n=1 Tax=Halorientalis marina TaxID=2931976 RepID=UPI001FF68AEA|nr:phage terminase large subunit family protein [Halorientalis marina]